MSDHCMKLSAVKFGFALGLIWALSVLLTGWAGAIWGYAMPWIRLLASVYLGYAATFWGAIVGAIWAFVDLFIFGLLVGWVYNCSCAKKKSAVAESS